MAELKVSRTLVKSSPELWAECSDAGSLARHLGAFGEIQITKLEPETAVAWEGEDVCGTVTFEPSGWGTRVVLTASADAESARVPAPAADPAASEPNGAGFFRRVFAGWRHTPDPVEPAPAAAEALGARDRGPDSDRAGALVSALDSLGMAHRRPFTHG